MAKTDNLTDFLTGVAEAIRTKKGTTAKINPQDFETEISSITTSKPEQEKTVEPTSSRQNIYPDNGKALSRVIVEAAPLPSVRNTEYKNINKCLINKKNKTLILGCDDSRIPSDGSVTSIGSSAFHDCRGLTIITIHDSVTSIGNYAFSGCSGLTRVAIRDGLTSIGNYAFEGCSGLTSITIPNSVKSIGESAFSNCSSLTSITIPNRVTSIGNSTFYGCSSLTSVTIPDSVTSISSYAFYKCSGLTSVTIGNNVTSIGRSTFNGCIELTSITIAPGNKKYRSDGNCIIETGSKKIIFGCKGSIIPTDGSVTSIGDSAFEGCSGLTSITIPDSVTSIGYGVFYGCSGLTNITIPDSVTSISNETFRDCSGLTSVTIGNGVTSIGESAFYGCSGLTSITIGNGVTSIGNLAFRDCSGLTSITIPSSVTSIDSSTFYGCSGLEKISVVTGNPKYHSAGNCLIETKTKTLIFGCKGSIIPTNGSVTTIGSSAFGGCSGLTSVTIPNRVTSIGYNAFQGCSSLTSIKVLPTTPPTLSGSDVFPSNVTTITVPVGCGNKYKTANRWSTYADKIVEAKV